LTASLERAKKTSDFFAVFPKNVSDFLRRAADAKCIPYGGMLAGVLGLHPLNPRTPNTKTHTPTRTHAHT